MFDRRMVSRARAEHQSGILKQAGSFQYVLFLGGVSMRAIVRTRAELFTETVAREAANFDVVVNGNYFGATQDGKFDALIGHDPVNPAETLIEGRVVRAGQPTLGDGRPQRFFISEIAEPRVGDPSGTAAIRDRAG